MLEPEGHSETHREDTRVSGTRTAHIWWLLAFILANDASYFVRSGGGRAFLTGGADQSESIGFPLAFWVSGGFAGVHGFDVGAMLIDLVAGALICWVGPQVWRPASQKRVCGWLQPKEGRVARVCVIGSWLWLVAVALLMVLHCRLGFYAVTVALPIGFLFRPGYGTHTRDVLPLFAAVLGVAVFATFRACPAELGWDSRVVRLFVSWSAQCIIVVFVRDWAAFLERLRRT
jgi:hypothetical protein